MISGIHAAYKSAVESVERLDCVDVPRSELLRRLASAQSEYAGSREAALRLEDRLRGALKQTEAGIEQVSLISYELCLYIYLHRISCICSC